MCVVAGSVCQIKDQIKDLALYGGKLAQPDLTYQIYEKHFIGYQKYRNKDWDKPANSERTLQMAKEKW